jgi:large subunit ribosomal protein L18
MFEKKVARQRRARKTRLKIAELRVIRLTVHRTNSHIYAQIIDADGQRVIAAASSSEKDVRTAEPNGGNTKAAASVGRRIAEKARQLGIESVAFDRSGFRYHGRVKALAEAAREAGLKF